MSHSSSRLSRSASKRKQPKEESDDDTVNVKQEEQSSDPNAASSTSHVLTATLSAPPSSLKSPPVSASKRALRSRNGSTKIEIKYETEEKEPAVKSEVVVSKSQQNGDDMIGEATASVSSPIKKTKSAPASSSSTRAPPAEWLRVFLGIENMRYRSIARNAPVDTVGCERLADPNSPPQVHRFQVLVSLMLSAQTKDAVTAAAMNNLQAHWPDGCTVENILKASVDEIDQLICKVGFHQRKADFIHRTAAILKERYNSDIPATLDELIALPGVGPKMAHLTMQVAWKQIVGIGVDTHVHRISGRLGWVKNAPTPEHTRKSLEEWLPRDYWGPINHLMVGFGQLVCLPIGPRCRACEVNSLCPEGRKALRKDPSMLHELPPLQSIDQIQKQDDAAAAKVLNEEQPAGIGPVTSRYFSSFGHSSSSSSVNAPAAAAAAPILSTDQVIKDEPMDAAPDAPSSTLSTSAIPWSVVKREPRVKAEEQQANEETNMENPGKKQRRH